MSHAPESPRSTLALVPARGGSKGIPRKNLKLLGGRPLIAWTIDAARQATMVGDVIVSTDDEEIAAVARECGASVPFLRPAALATDDTPGIAPVLHALDQLPGVTAVVMLQPTSPFRTAADIDGCIRLAASCEASAAVSVSEVEQHPSWMYTLAGGSRLNPVLPGPVPPRRQDLPPVFTLNGAVYFAAAAWLRQHGTFLTPETVGYVMPPDRSLDLDTPADWALAERQVQDIT